MTDQDDIRNAASRLAHDQDIKDKSRTFWDIFASAQIQFAKHGIEKGILRIETIGDRDPKEDVRFIRLTLLDEVDGEQRRTKMDFPDGFWRCGFESAVRTLIAEAKGENQ